MEDYTLLAQKYNFRIILDTQVSLTGQEMKLEIRGFERILLPELRGESGHG
jgi:hypothetical protein